MIDLIDNNLINLNLQAESQLQAIESLTKLLFKSKRISSKEDFIEGVLNREAEITTGFGNGIAIPHCKSKSVLKPSIVIGKNKKLIDWNAMDGKGVYFIILLAVPHDNGNAIHLKILSELSSKLIDDDFRESLVNCKCPLELLNLLNNVLKFEREE